MGQHFVGHVYLFHEAPLDELPFVDIPAVSQTENSPSSLLIQFEEEDLDTSSKDKLEPYFTQSLLDISTIKRNIGVDLEAQLRLARHLIENASSLHGLLNWRTSVPNYDQLQTVCNLIWNHFNGSRVASGRVRSAKQLAFLLSRLTERQPVSVLISRQISFSNSSADDAVETVLDFLRLWASFNFPRFLRVLDNIQQDVFNRLGLSSGRYEQYATLVDNQFFDPALMALDEYGLPLEIAKKLVQHLQPNGDLDAILQRIKVIDVNRLNLSLFEREILEDTIAGL